jgi:hypothetical protein
MDSPKFIILISCSPRSQRNNYSWFKVEMEHFCAQKIQFEYEILLVLIFKDKIFQNPLFSKALHYRTRATITRSWILTIHKAKGHSTSMNFKKWVKSIQTARYNGVHTVIHLPSTFYYYFFFAISISKITRIITPQNPEDPPGNKFHSPKPRGTRKTCSFCFLFPKEWHLVRNCKIYKIYTIYKCENRLVKIKENGLKLEQGYYPRVW